MILTNEEYIGDSLYQKFFNDNNVPFLERTNRGEKEQYYLEQTHQGIISKQQFEAVKQRIKNYQFVHTRKNSIFNMRITCGRCVSFYKLKTNNGITCWVCRKHDTHSDDCKSGIIQETKIEATFICLFNKLFLIILNCLFLYKKLYKSLKLNR